MILNTDRIPITRLEMRIGIVSLYGWLKLWDNYGTLLQNFALQTFLRQQGHSSFWIRTRPSLPVQGRSERIWSEVIARSRVLLRILATPLLGKPRSARLAEFNQRNPRHFQEFMLRHIPASSREFTIEELVEEPPMVDALIVGSDQVWREVTRLNFLGFGPRGLRRVAYGVSAPWPSLDERWYESAIHYTPQLDAVSVRELEGVEVCGRLGREDVVHVVDPVLLLEASHYLDVVRRDGEDHAFGSPFIIGYFVNVQHIENIPWEATLGFAKIRGADLRVVPLQGAELVIPEAYVFTPSPSAWINAFHKANCVVTNSYHGALFAIVMKKPFLVFLQSGTSAPENCRFSSALEPLGLYDRVLSPNSWCDMTPSALDDLMSRPIDWCAVDVALSRWKKDSARFLNNALAT